MFDGKPLSLTSIQDAMHYGIGYVAEDRLNESLFLDKSIALNMSATLYNTTLKKNKLIDDKKLVDLVTTWKENLSIKTDDLSLAVSSLSGGNQQRVALSKWLMRDDLRLLILNRPTVGVDIKSKDEINEIISAFTKKGVSFVLISDDLHELVQLCHKVYFVQNNKISRCFEGEEISLSNLKDELNKE